MRKTLPKFYDEERDLIECQICKRWRKMLNNTHLRMHGTTCKEYKEKYGLIWGDLIALSVRQKMSNSGKMHAKESKKRFNKFAKPKLQEAYNKPKTRNQRTRECRTTLITPQKRKALSVGHKKYWQKRRNKIY